MKNCFRKITMPTSRTAHGLSALAVLSMCSLNALADNNQRDYWSNFAEYRHAIRNDAANRVLEDNRKGLLDLSFHIQTRYLINSRSNIPEGDLSLGFETRRTKIKASGRLDDTPLSYSIGMAFSRKTGAMELNEVSTRFKINKEWTLKIGRIRPTVMREQDISSKSQLAAERSLINAAFGQSYGNGLSLRYSNKDFRVSGSVVDTSDGLDGDNIMEYIIRGELMLVGDRSEMSDFTSFRDDSPALMIGAGLAYRDSDPADPSDEDSRLLTWSADLSAEFGGSNLFLSITGSTLDEAGSSPVDQFGSLAQGGVFVSDKDELFIRYSYGHKQGGRNLNLIELGINHYIHKHSAKITVDFGYSFDEMGSPWRSTGAGWLKDTKGEEGQFLLRTQFQILF